MTTTENRVAQVAGPIALLCCAFALSCTILPHGRSAVDAWTQASRAGQEAREAGDARLSLRYFTSAADIAEAKLADRGTYLSESLLALGSAHEALREYDASLRCTEKALPIVMRTYGGKHSRVVRALAAAGRRAFLADSAGAAVDYLSRAIAIETAKGGAASAPLVAESQYWMGRVCLGRRDFDNAACLLRMSIDNLEAGGARDGQTMADGLLYLGIACAMAEDFPRARQSLEQALRRSVALRGAESAEAAQAEEWLGWVSWSQGDVDGAIRHTENALSVYLSRHTADEVADMYGRIAGYYDRKGCRGRAAEYRAKLAGIQAAM